MGSVYTMGEKGVSNSIFLDFSSRNYIFAHFCVKNTFNTLKNRFGASKEFFNHQHRIQHPKISGNTYLTRFFWIFHREIIFLAHFCVKTHFQHTEKQVWSFQRIFLSSASYSASQN